MTSPPPAAATVTPGVAGRTDYAAWDQVTKTLVHQVEADDQVERQAQQAALGLDGKYARSQDEAAEREKARVAKQTKKKLDAYETRQNKLMQSLPALLGPVDPTLVVTVPLPKEQKDDAVVETLPETKAQEPTTIRITRDRMEAGKRVLMVTDTMGQYPNRKDTIVLTQDLSLLESKMGGGIHAGAKQKSYPDDAENDVPEEPPQAPRSIYGLIKVFLANVHNCTILIKCKIISGTLEMHNCSNVTVRILDEATVATVQVDLCAHVCLSFENAPSGKNVAQHKDAKDCLYWGQDKDDRIFHAGVADMTVQILHQGVVETTRTADYLADGAVAIGNATPQEFQFVTAVCLDEGHDQQGCLVTETVVRAGSTTGKHVRAMTEREIKAEEARRQRAAAVAVGMAEDMIQIKDKDGNALAKKVPVVVQEEEEEEVEEIFTMSADDIKEIVDECQLNKRRGNEAFGTGEYGQAILLYSLALDKADELPDGATDRKLFPRDVVYANRAACFLKLGQHEKAEADASTALDRNPDNIKALFRQGLALHAMGRYQDALPLLARAHTREPNNSQVKQALQFCEVRMHQDMQKRSNG